MTTFVLALCIELSLLVFVLAAVWFSFGWVGIVVFFVNTALVNYMFLQAREEIIRRRLLARGKPK